MKRANLDALDREALIRLAEEHGVTRPRILTRPELVDEILLRGEPEAGVDASIARGFFGLARDLVARVVERGLHLPDAASRIRSLAMDAPRRSSRAAVLPTVTLAQIYADQGHTERALETLRRVLEAEPEHAEARALVAQLEDARYTPPKAPLPPEPEEPVAEAADGAEAEESPAGPGQEAAAESVEATTERTEAGVESVEAAAESVEAAESTWPEPLAPREIPAPPLPGVASPAAESVMPPEATTGPIGMLDDSPLPPRYEVDECVAIPVDPEALFVYWELRAELVARVRALRGEGVLALRALVIEPGWHGPRTSVRDHDVHADLGDFFLRDLPSGAVVRVAIGFRTPEAFLPLRHAPLLELPRRSPVEALGHTFVRWTPGGEVPEQNPRLEELSALALERARVERAHELADAQAAQAASGGEQGDARGRCAAQGAAQASVPLGSS